MNTITGVLDSETLHQINAVRSQFVPKGERAGRICHEASVALSSRIPNSRAVRGFVRVPGIWLHHWWVEWEETVIDISIDQLGPQHPAVMICDWPTAERLGYVHFDDFLEWLANRRNNHQTITKQFTDKELVNEEQ